ncbi:Pentatricopeptide repeat-containing protein [Apostasia shenzhenica]|uniref:Pentatricopeptide repeat-containing protein n=1 Tax=Apostasia shenzhenica TaxID=1088818 RepID=A0A2I0B6K6_9ASPA|nr:Pentatricopeptide repeat-containing protein [Apostasia shenzhenica]
MFLQFFSVAHCLLFPKLGELTCEDRDDGGQRSGGREMVSEDFVVLRNRQCSRCLYMVAVERQAQNRERAMAEGLKGLDGASGQTAGRQIPTANGSLLTWETRPTFLQLGIPSENPLLTDVTLIGFSGEIVFSLGFVNTPIIVKNANNRVTHIVSFIMDFNYYFKLHYTSFSKIEELPVLGGCRGWNAIMTGYYLMPITLNNILKWMEKCTSFRSLKQIHAQITINGFLCDNLVAVKLVSFCSKTLGNVSYAGMIFNSFLGSANVYLWTAMIASYSTQELEVIRGAIVTYRMMLKLGTCPNNFTISAVLKACSSLKAITEGKQVHAHSTKLGFISCVYVQTTLIDLYAKSGWVHEAKYLFDNMAEKNVATCNVMMSCHVKAGDVTAARGVFDQICRRDTVSWTTMIYGYAINGHMFAANEIFDQMPEKEINAWNSLMIGYSHTGEWNQSIKLFMEMQRSFVKPNQATMAMLMSSCAQSGAAIVAKQLHGFLQKSCITLGLYVYNSLVDVYAKCGIMHEAISVFLEIPKKDVVSYNTLIIGLANHSYVERALKLFHEMLDSDIQPDTITFTGILNACSQNGLVNLALYYFDCMKNYAIMPSADHYACIIDLFGRLGFIDRAYELVKTMEVEPHAGVWGALLNACSKYCHIEIGRIAALELFRIEPGNPGNYILLSNIFAKAHLWEGVKEVRCLMRRKGVAKAAGYSWIEVNNQVCEFIMGDANHPFSEEIYAVLMHISLQQVVLPSENFQIFNPKLTLWEGVKEPKPSKSGKVLDEKRVAKAAG